MLSCDHKSPLSCVQGKRRPCGRALCSQSVMRFRICQTCFSCAAASRMHSTQICLEYYADKLLPQYKVHLCIQISITNFEYGVGGFFNSINPTVCSRPRMRTSPRPRIGCCQTAARAIKCKYVWVWKVATCHAVFAFYKKFVLHDQQERHSLCYADRAFLMRKAHRAAL